MELNEGTMLDEQVIFGHRASQMNQCPRRIGCEVVESVEHGIPWIVRDAKCLVIDKCDKPVVVLTGYCQLNENLTLNRQFTWL